MNIEGKGKKRVPVPVPVGRAVWGNTVDRERGKPGNLKMRIILFYLFFKKKRKEKERETETTGGNFANSLHHLDCHHYGVG